MDTNKKQNKKKCTKDSRLQLLHWKILHKIYPTGILLHKMGICSSNKCTFFDEIDYLELVFFFLVLQKGSFTMASMHRLYKSYNKITCYSNSKRCFFGYYTDTVAEEKSLLINHLILISKMCTSKNKYGIQTSFEYLFQEQVLLRKKKKTPQNVMMVCVIQQISIKKGRKFL